MHKLPSVSWGRAEHRIPPRLRPRTAQRRPPSEGGDAGCPWCNKIPEDLCPKCRSRMRYVWWPSPQRPRFVPGIVGRAKLRQPMFGRGSPCRHPSCLCLFTQCRTVRIVWGNFCGSSSNSVLPKVWDVKGRNLQVHTGQNVELSTLFSQSTRRGMTRSLASQTCKGRCTSDWHLSLVAGQL